MEKMEFRILPTTLTTTDEGMFVEGLVNQTEKLSHTLGVRKKFKEKISKGAFQRALNKGNTIDFLAEHDNKMLLATTANNSLELFEDEEGLKMRAKISDTTYGRDIYTLMKDGVIRNMSFGFKTVSDKWRKLPDGIFERTVDDLNLFEVSAVRNPAYPQSTISARGIEILEDVDIPEDLEENKDEVRDMEKENIEQEQISVEEFRNLVEICKGLVNDVKELSEKIEKRDNDNKDVEKETSEEVKTEETPVDEVKEEVKEVEEVKTEEVKEDKKDEDKKEDRSLDLTSYLDRINKLDKKENKI